VSWTVEGRPTVSNASLTTVTGQPQLSLTIASGTAEPALRSVALTLPAGLRLARVLSGIQVHSASGTKLPFSRRVQGDTLTITLETASPRFRVLLVPGTLVATANVQAESTRVTPPSLRIGITAVDSSAASSTIGARVRPRA
jgi:hypothetical protein